jgi:hypothetical protein
MPQELILLIPKKSLEKEGDYPLIYLLKNS